MATQLERDLQKEIAVLKKIGEGVKILKSFIFICLCLCVYRFTFVCNIPVFTNVDLQRMNQSKVQYDSQLQENEAVKSVTSFPSPFF